MLSKRGGRSAGGERRNRVIPASLIAILEADNPLQCELKRIILNEPVLFMPGKTFSKLLHCITGYCILCDNEQFFSFRQVRARLLINRKKGDVLLLLPQFNTCSSSGVFDRLLVKKSFDLLRLFLNASHMGFCMFFKLSIPFCRRSFGKGRFQIPVQ